MASPDLVIGYHKLDTKFFAGHIQHTTFHSDASQGRRRVKIVTKWYRNRELGRGSFGTVFLEKSERGDSRAVKEIAKDKNSAVRIDYKRELMAMAILAKHDALFVQLFGWYESDNYVYIAMEYISHGHLRNYLQVERSESEAKAITRQLLEGLVVIHQEGFAHRDLKPENIFVVSASPVWVKIGDFGLAKLAREGTTLRTEAFSAGYSAPEMGIDTSGDSSEYTNAVDIWAVGCITHEVLTRVLPFPSISQLSLYCIRPEFPRNSMLAKNISRKGMEIVESMLAFHPERRIPAKEALDSEWLQLEEEGQDGLEVQEDEGREWWEIEEDDGQGGLETEEHTAGPAISWALTPSGAEVANGGSLPGSNNEWFHNRVAVAMDVKEPWGYARTSMNGQVQVTSVSLYPDAFGNPKKCYPTISPDVKGALKLVLKEIQRSTDSPYKPMLSDEDAVYMLLSGVISMDIRDSGGNTPLHVAVRWFSRHRAYNKISPSPLRLLVASGADIDAKNSRGKTPLYLAVGYGSSTVSRKLLELGANVEEPDLDGIRPLIKAVQQGSERLVALLLDHRAFVGTIQVKQNPFTPLHEAARLGSNAICRLILQGGASVNARDILWQTPLHKAVTNGHLLVASFLIAAGANINARDISQRTALHYAIRKNLLLLTQLLLDRGANQDVVDKDGVSPLQAAAGANGILVKLMVDGALRRRGDRNRFPLSYYTRGKYLGEQLFGTGAD